MDIDKLIADGILRPFAGGSLSRTDLSRPLVVLNPRKIAIEADTSEQVRLVIVHTEPNEAAIDLSLAAGVQVTLTEICLAGTFTEVRIRQAEQSSCRIVAVQLHGANTAYRIDLAEHGAENDIAALFLATDSEHCVVNLSTNHLVSQCTSRALVKGIAAGRATGEFRGLVYVAPDAQQTDAQQQSRNIELGEGHIIAMPQLEIYADDVRCSHGATVGQLADEAIFYMRQRGLSEDDARRLQIEGFANDIVNRCDIAEIREFLATAIAEQLQKL